MNIIAPIPIPIVFNTGTVNTESVKRDNTLREAVPQLAANEKSAGETGVGSESDKVKTPGQTPQPLTYEKPVSQAGQLFSNQNELTKDNGKDPSAGKENAEDQQQQQAEQRKIAELKQRDAEVRAHEQSHAALGGQYADSPQYEYERGPDGRQYAVGGEVSIDVSEAATPEETLRKAQQVKAAALAPAEPSAQDLRVATEASQIALEARTEIANERAEEALQAYKEAIPDNQIVQEQNTQKIMGGQTPDLEEIVDALDVSVPKRSLDVSESETTQKRVSDFYYDVEGAKQFIANRDLAMNRRVSVIESFYQQATNPRNEGISQSA
jgi:hypothetical protein